MITTTPTVPYIFHFYDGSWVLSSLPPFSSNCLQSLGFCVVNDRTLEINNPAALPSNPKQRVVRAEEPVVNATIISPKEYV